MKITEKQLTKIMFYLNPLIIPHSKLTEDGRDNLSMLLEEITNQQSDELKEIE